MYRIPFLTFVSTNATRLSLPETVTDSFSPWLSTTLPNVPISTPVKLLASRLSLMIVSEGLIRLPPPTSGKEHPTAIKLMRSVYKDVLSAGFITSFLSLIIQVLACADAHVTSSTAGNDLHLLDSPF